jgi:hypothetical protein
MKRLIQLNLLLLLVSSATAQESSPRQPPKTLHVFDWKDLSAQFTNSQIISMDGMSVLKIENTNNAPLKVLLLAVTNSSLVQKASTIEWEMKYENVYSSNGLPPEMFSTSLDDALLGRENSTNYPNVCFFEKFPPQVAGGDNFTNYIVDYFNGAKNWDKYYFGLRRAPYDNQTRPEELKLEIFLPSNGTVYLRAIKLLGMANNFNSWWSSQQSGVIGGIGGSIIGCFGGLIGWLVSKGKARKFVLAATTSSIVLGILLIITGLVAAILKQPYSVWYVLLLPGVILVLVFSLNLHSIQGRYDELEIRRMTSVDTMGS